MRDEDKTKEVLIKELNELRQKVSGFPIYKSDEKLELFNALLNQSNDAIFIIEPESGRFLDVNNKACSNLRYLRDELLDMGVSDIETILPDNFSWQAHVKEVKEQGNMILEGAHKRSDGTTFPVEVSLRYVTQGKNDYMIAVVRDITDRRMAENMRLADQRRLMQELIDSLPGTFYLIDENGNIERWNKYFEEVSGYSSEEIKAMTILDFIPEDEKIYVMKKMKGMFTSGKNTVDVNLLSKDGRKTPYCVTVGRTTIKDTSYIVGVGMDVSQQKKLEQEIIKAQKLESIGTLAGGIAHDFNNILTAVLGNISLARLSRPSLMHGDDMYNKLSEAEKAILRAKDLTKQLLTFSKGGEPLKKTLSLGEVIKEVADFALIGSNVKCAYLIAEDLRPVDADEGQITQVIHNLIINAGHAMPNGGIITIRAENVCIDAEDFLHLKKGDYIKVSIEDSGIGIPEEHFQKIFDPYFTTKQKGSGLGLSTAYSIIKKHDGMITVDSILGKGTTFHIYLPVSEKEVAAETYAEKAIIHGNGRILLMDDEEMIRNVAGEILEYIGYKVEFAAGGQEAIDLYNRGIEEGKPFDLVIMDLTIPGGMNGKDAIIELLKSDPGIKVIVSSGYSNDPILSDYEKYGFKGVAVKPYKVTELSHIVYGVITNKI